MSDNIDIRIREDGSRVVSRNLDEIAKKADAAGTAVVDMNKKIDSSSGNATALTKLQSLIKMAESYGTGMVKQLDQTSSSYRNTLMKHFEMVSKSARASASAIKSQMEVLTATPVGMGALNAYFKEQEGSVKSLANVNEVAALRISQANDRAWSRDYARKQMAQEQQDLTKFVNNAAAQMTKRENDEKRSDDKRLAAALKKIENEKIAESNYTAWWATELKKRDAAQALARKGTVLTPTTMNSSGATGNGAMSVNALAANNARLSSATASASAKQAEWNSIAKDGHAAARGLSGSLGTLWMTYGSIAPLLAGAAIGAAFKEAAASGSEFAYQLTFVKALGGESADAIKKLADQAKDLAKSSSYGPTDIASGYRILAQAGLDAAEALKIMPDVLNLATVGELSMENAGIAVVGTLNAFKLGMGDASRISDLFAKAAAVSQSNVTDLTSAMKTASTAGTQYGQSVEDTMTALALMAKVNIVGTSAGTAYRNMLKEIYTPTKQAAKAWADLNIETTKMVNGQRQTRDFVDIMYDLKNATAKFDNPSQGKIIGYLFGERGAKEAAEMLDMTYNDWKDFQNKITNSEGFGAKVAKELNDTAKNQWKQALNTLEVELINAFDRMEPQFVSLAQQFKTIFESQDFRTAVDIILSSMVTLIKAFVDLAPVIVEVAKAWLVLKAAQAGAGIATLMGTAATAAQGLAGAMLAASGAMGPVARGATVMGPLIAALGGPITIVAALLAAGATAWLIWGNSSKEACDKAANAANAASASIQNLMEQQQAGMTINSVSWTYAANKAIKAKADVEKQINDQLNNSNQVTNMGLRFGNGMVFDSSNKDITDTIKQGKGWTRDVASLLGQYNTLTGDIRTANDNMKDAVNAEGKAKAALEAAAKPKTPVVTPTGNNVWTPPTTDKTGKGPSGRLSKDDEALAKMKSRLDISKEEYAQIEKYGQAQFQLNEGQKAALEIQNKIVALQKMSNDELKEKGLAGRAEQLASLKSQLNYATELGEQLKKNELLKVDKKFDEEVRIAKMLPIERDKENKFIQFRNELLGKGITLDETQAKTLRDKISAQIELNKVTAIRDNLLQNSDSQKATDFSNSQQGLKAAQQTPDWTQNDTDRNSMTTLSGMGIDISQMEEQTNTQLELLRTYYGQIEEMKAAGFLSDQTYANAKLQLDQQTNAIRLQNVSSFFGSLATLQSSSNKTLGAIGKAAAMTQATMDGINAVQKAYTATPYPWNIPAAAAQGALAAANVAKIAGLNFATGGGFTVGGTGGTDSQNVSFRASPGERVSVSTPQQVRKADEHRQNQQANSNNGNSGGVKIINVVDPSMLQDYLSTPAGEKVLVNTIQRNAGSIRNVING